MSFLALSRQLRTMSAIAPELYEFGKQTRDLANRVAANPKTKQPPLLLATQLERMRRLDAVYGPRLWEWGAQLRDTLNARAANPGVKQPPLGLGQQLAAMKQIDQRLYEFGAQMVDFVNGL